MTEPGTGRVPRDITERVIVVIEAVVDAAEPVGPRGLARLSGIDRSTAGRILRRLGEMDVLERVTDGYRPGARLLTLSRVLAARDTLPEAIGPILGTLVDRFDETCYVCAFHGDVAVFTHEIQSSKPLRLVVELGRPVPLHAGAAGRAILAGLPPETAREVLGTEPLTRVMPDTVTDVDRLLEMAEEDRRRGWTVSREERIKGGAAIAAPFFDHRGRCHGSVVFTLPMSRLEEDHLPEIGQAVAKAAKALSERLGRAADV